MKDTVTVSVLMSVYNTKAAWLREAVDSILAQTFTDFEFIIIDDKTTDGSVDILREYRDRDARIVLIENDENRGVTKNLNAGLRIARGQYIARMDADDRAVPERLARQVAYMDAHPSVAVCGGYLYTGSKKPSFLTAYRDDPDERAVRMLFSNAGVPHPTAMIRKSFLNEHGIWYNEQMRKSQDYGLWVDCTLAQHDCIRLLPEVLLCYRVHDGQLSAGRASQNEYSQIAVGRMLRTVLPEYTPDELAFHTGIMTQLPRAESRAYIEHFRKLAEGNAKTGAFEPRLFENSLRALWLHLCEYRLRHVKKADFLCTAYTWRSVFSGGWRLYCRYFFENKRRCRRAIAAYRNTKESAGWVFGEK